MKKLLALWMISACAYAYADDAWISDRLEAPVKESPSLSASLLALLPAGKQVEVIKRNSAGDYVQIRFDNKTGWISSHYLMNNPSLHIRLEESDRQLSELRLNHQNLQVKVDDMNRTIENLTNENTRLKQQEGQARQELAKLKRVSQNVIAIDERNKILQESVVRLEQENQKIMNENIRLLDAANDRKLIIGGALMFAGFLLQWLWTIFNRSRISRRSNFSDL